MTDEKVKQCNCNEETVKEMLTSWTSSYAMRAPTALSMIQW